MLGLLVCTSARGDVKDIDFQRDVRPILQTKCLKCHGPYEPAGELDLTRRESAIELQAVVPGQADASTLIQRITAADDAIRMPHQSPALSAHEIAILQSWIVSGAHWPAHWAYEPLKEIEPPELRSKSLQQWCQTPIDYFVAAAQELRGLVPSPLANRRTLLRRASFELRGLPPTTDELNTFLSDDTPDAWAKCVDRLLESPAYGERWARHWMDLVHFAETHGHDQDRPREHAWPYRDYLVRSFNQDKPYHQFVREQVAGDVLDPLNPDAIVATGFLAAGPWDESSLRDIREDSIDRVAGQYLDRDDIVTTVMSTFMSTSVHCARCHDHKFDTISQREYYGLQAVFAGIDKANRPYDPDPKVAGQRASLQSQLRDLEEQYAADPPALLTDEANAIVAEWESTDEAMPVRWLPMELVSAVSQGGATLTVDTSHHTVLASGTRPDKDIYSIDAITDLRQISALRLELIPHDDLPMRGPGRNDNGNLHLNTIRCFEVLTEPDHLREWSFKKPLADFNQQGWSIDMSVDGDPNTAWGIYPEVGRLHQGVFPLSEVRTSSQPQRLRIELHQIHGGGHLIGCLRLSVTDVGASLLEQSTTIPEDIAQILQVPRHQRSMDQRAVIAYWILTRRLTQQLGALPTEQFVYVGTNQFAADGSFRPAEKPRTIHVLRRGLLAEPGDEATAGALSLIPSLPSQLAVRQADNEGARREALANWLTDQRNPLLWRSIANRVWQHCIGRPLVDTPNDFGQMGAMPSHPELLDWMAYYLQQHGGSLKELQRLILTSAVYQQQSTNRTDGAEVDQENRYLWRMNGRRLDAESYRDALLQVTGVLDSTIGGPSVRQFIETPGVHVTPNVDYDHFDPGDPSQTRRSIYRFLFRTVPDPFMEALDCPDASQLAPQRNSSLTAVQALATLNDKLVVHLSQRFAESPEADQPELEPQVRLGYRRLFGRDPHNDELQRVTEYARQHGLANACRVLFNTNEFLFVD